MSKLLSRAVIWKLDGKKPWPEDACLYQPGEDEEMLLPDAVSCLCAQAILHINDLAYHTKTRYNAEYMSPSGRLPLLHAGTALVSEIEPIIDYIKYRGHTKTEFEDNETNAELQAYMALVSSSLTNAELFFTWADGEVYSNVTHAMYGSPYRWPLSSLIPRMKRYDVTNQLKAAKWADKSFEQVCVEVEKCCQALSQKLGDQKYFFGDKPCDLDAVVYGHLQTYMTSPLPVDEFANIVKRIHNLVKFCENMSTIYFKE